jgi:hypothetical protein
MRESKLQGFFNELVDGFLVLVAAVIGMLMAEV